MIERPKQRNCQNEPAYPGAETIVMTLVDPEWIVHERCAECPCEYPHLWDRCGRARMTEEQIRLRAFDAMLSIGGLNIPIEKFEFKIEFYNKYGVLAPDKVLFFPVAVT